MFIVLLQSGSRGAGRSSGSPTVRQQILKLLGVAFAVELTQLLVEPCPWEQCARTDPHTGRGDGIAQSVWLCLSVA